MGAMDAEAVTIVSGLPRSGTSLMMAMLEAGGILVLTDHIRGADEDNPKGYYEFEQIKQIKEDPACLDQAHGKVVKVISELLVHVPRHYLCRVIFMRRAMDEILASQRQMLLRRGKADDAVDDATMATLFNKHLQRVESWLSQQSNMSVLYVSYNELLVYPDTFIEQINLFLGGTLDTSRMKQTIDKRLYRQRSRQGAVGDVTGSDG